MRLAGRGGALHLGYCTNIHAGHSWPEISASLDAHVPAIKAALSPQQPFGIGLRLSAQAAQVLLEAPALHAFQAQLARLGAYVFTVNAFPYGPFHGERVKEQVYLPDWRAAERVAFSVACASILAQLLPDGVDGSISTVPGAFKSNGALAGAPQLMAARMLETVAALVEIERRRGQRIALALEPEPCCFLETVDQTMAFFETHLLAPAALALLGRLCGVGPGAAEALLRRHLGVCYDVCHAAVEFEDPVAALDRLVAAGIAVPKIQLSSALRIARMDEGLIEALMRYDDGVYLHQVVTRDGALQRYTDLPEAVAAFRRGAAQGEWRVHCHVPVFLDQLAQFGTTQASLLATLDGLREKTWSRHLEVETYTWDVLPAALRVESKDAAIARELAFILKELDYE
ncbi:hypothetical protein AAKU55_001719 [Oxalobacteraceae bacterium GrIS 1.11]